MAREPKSIFDQFIGAIGFMWLLALIGSTVDFIKISGPIKSADKILMVVLWLPIFVILYLIFRNNK